MGADLRAATILNQEVAAQGDSGHPRCSHIENGIFMKDMMSGPPHDLGPDRAGPSSIFILWGAAWRHEWLV